jgi:hypothetical protein
MILGNQRQIEQLFSFAVTLSVDIQSPQPKLADDLPCPIIFVDYEVRGLGRGGVPRFFGFFAIP